MADKKRGSKYRNTNEITAFDYGIDEPLLDAFCAYSISMNSSIHKYGLSMLKKFTEMLSEDMFTKNQKMLIKFRFLKSAINARLEGITKRDFLISIIDRHLEGAKELAKDIMADQSFSRELSNDEVIYIEKTISSFMNNSYLNSYVSQWMDLCNQYRSGNYRERDNLLPQIKDCMTGALSQFRRNDMAKEDSTNIFRLSSINDSIPDVYNYITAPSYRLITGMSGLNDMLGGGFEKAREYIFMALSGEGKTITLINMYYQIWENNKGFKTRDPTKKPALVYLTMEDFVVELVSALYYIITRGKDMKDCKDPNEALEELRKANFQYSDNDIEMVIKFMPVNSVDTNYMYRITEELEDEGYEVIGFFQDYLMRILPSIITKDQYKDFGTVANDFKTFATIKQCPVISASQLNREAARIIDESRGKNDPNLVKKLGRANAGDSVNIERNVDGLFILVPEYSASGEKYMGIKCVKHRYKVYTNNLSIYQPFYPGTEIALMEDLFNPTPAYRLNLSRDEQEMQQRFGLVTQNNFEMLQSTLAEMNGSTIENNVKQMMQPGFSDIPVPVKEEKQEVSWNFENTVTKKKKEVVFFDVPEEEIEMKELLL